MKRWTKTRLFGIETIDSNSPEAVAAEGLAYALSTTYLRKGRIVESRSSGAPVARLHREGFWIITRSPFCILPYNILCLAEDYIKAHLDEIPDENWCYRVSEWLKGHSYSCWKGEEMLAHPERLLPTVELPEGHNYVWGCKDIPGYRNKLQVRIAEDRLTFGPEPTRPSEGLDYGSDAYEWEWAEYNFAYFHIYLGRYYDSPKWMNGVFKGGVVDPTYPGNEWAAKKAAEQSAVEAHNDRVGEDTVRYCPLP